MFLFLFFGPLLEETGEYEITIYRTLRLYHKFSRQLSLALLYSIVRAERDGDRFLLLFNVLRTAFPLNKTKKQFYILYEFKIQSVYMIKESKNLIVLKNMKYILFYYRIHFACLFTRIMAMKNIHIIY